MSCAMICGSSNIWPMPTGKFSLSSRSLTFKSNQLKFDVKTTFTEAKQLLGNAYDIFISDLKFLENRQLNLDINNNNNNVDYSNNNMNNDYNKNDDDGANASDKDANKMQNCDISKITINAEIQTFGDTALHMDVDESYELNITS